MTSIMSVQENRGHTSRGQDPLQQLLASTDTSIVLESDESAPNVLSAPFIFLSTLTLENLSSSAEPAEFLLSEASNELSVAFEGNGRISQGFTWKGEGDQSEDQETQILLSSNRYQNDHRRYDCDTQTYHTTTTMENLLDMETGIDEGNMRVCCVHDCESRTNDTSKQTKFYTIPVDELQLRLWADSLEIDLSENVLINGLAICENHLVNPTVLFPEKSKKNFEYESGKFERGLALSRSKRKPKPNKAYDWAQVIPFMKPEISDGNNEETTFSFKGGRGPVTVSGHKRKQVLSFIKDESDEKENQQPIDAQIMGEVIDAVEYHENISEASAPRDPPPRSKGRARKIRDSPVQTEVTGCDKSVSSRKLREVKIQCDLKIQGPDVIDKSNKQQTCAGCSNIDWKKLSEVLSACVAEIEGSPCDPMVTNCLKKFLLDVMQPSHAANIIKMLANMHKDALDNGKNIILVSSQGDDEEVEIENVTFWEAPMSGVREITPSESWRKPISSLKQELPSLPLPTQDPLSASIFDIMACSDDPDELGLEAAAEMDDDEFNPADVAEDEDDEDEPEPDPEELTEDEDWDVRIGDDPPPKKKRKGIGGRVQKGIRIHRKLMVGSVSCRSCHRNFHHENQFNSHRCHAEKNRDIKMFSCDECGKMFSQKISLQYHTIYVHGGERKAACPHCDYKAPDKAKLSLHMRTHSQIRPYICNVCGATFKFKATLKTHVARHSNAGDYVCSICKKAFCTDSMLKEHSRIHSSERPFICVLCGMSFKQRKRLRIHERAVHLQDKRYACDICGSTYINNWNLKNHMRTHAHLNVLATYTCSTCSTTFRGKAGLAAHMRMRHGDMGEQEYKVVEVVQLAVGGSKGSTENQGLSGAVSIEHQALATDALPTEDVELRLIEIHSCYLCGHLCDSLDQLQQHALEEHVSTAVSCVL